MQQFDGGDWAGAKTKVNYNRGGSALNNRQGRNVSINAAQPIGVIVPLVIVPIGFLIATGTNIAEALQTLNLVT